MVIGVSAHVGNANSEAIPHTDYAELGDGILFEEFGHEVASVTDHE